MDGVSLLPGACGGLSRGHTRPGLLFQDFLDCRREEWCRKTSQEAVTGVQARERSSEQGGGRGDNDEWSDFSYFRFQPTEFPDGLDVEYGRKRVLGLSSMKDDTANN